ncbi:MAG: hypothetical protein A2X01_00690 [Bacteroidetes bacterium GWF2_35_48]|nr:MAG: hypothetical protein A2X01_00690 [Bacteroidetes bacterium GWF2_35_48]
MSASTTFNVSVPPETETEIERNRIKAQILLIRLDEINARDKSEMNFADKRKMRKEVRSIRWELNRIGGGVYISAGAIIIIVILLVIFL